MDIWARNVAEVGFASAVVNANDENLLKRIDFEISQVFPLREFNIKSFGSTLNAVPSIISNIFVLFRAMKWADHIHLRCPGNNSLLGCLVQIFFPNKSKSAKYAGNWDPNSTQPITYRIQKWILSSTFFTKKMKVLVYGEWPESSKNIKAFFTATYFEDEKIEASEKNFLKEIYFMFVGTLSPGKQPLYVVKLFHEIFKTYPNARLAIYGEGSERHNLEKFIKDENLDSCVFLMGNRNSAELKNAYIDSHFMVLPSLSEGWPKAVAEAMFWRCVPISTKVSCVPNMLADGNRGVLIDCNLQSDKSQIIAVISDHERYQQIAKAGMLWSREYTMDRFESEIKKLL